MPRFRERLSSAGSGAIRILLPLGLLAGTCRADYTVTVDMARPDELTMTLKLPKAEGAPHRLNVRGADWGLHPQVHSVRCGDTPLKQQKNGTWIADRSCPEVTWSVGAVVATDGTVDVSKQATLLFQQPRWLLLSEPTALLRLTDDTTARASAVTIRSGKALALGATSVGPRSWRVPPVNRAPEFFIIGELAARSRSVGAFEVRYVADNPGRVESLGLEVLHEKALEYLGRVLPPPPGLPAAERALLVVWVGIHERRGRAGGAAGNRSFLANYVIGKPESARLNAARTLMVLAHEQFHQLADLVRDPLPALPARLNESLAAYYGFKTLLQVSPGKDAESLRAELKQDATFWTEIDQALRASSAGASDLDALIPDLLRSNVGAGRRLPDAFVAALRARLGAQVDPLLAKYAGD